MDELSQTPFVITGKHYFDSDTRPGRGYNDLSHDNGFVYRSPMCEPCRAGYHAQCYSEQHPIAKRSCPCGRREHLQPSPALPVAA